MISANGGLPAHRYTPQVTPRWPRGSEPASQCPPQRPRAAYGKPPRTLNHREPKPGTRPHEHARRHHRDRRAPPNTAHTCPAHRGWRRQWKGTIPTRGPSRNRRGTAADMRRHTAAHTRHEPHSGHPLIRRQHGTPGTASPHRRSRRWAPNRRLSRDDPGQPDLARESCPRNTLHRRLSIGRAGESGTGLPDFCSGHPKMRASLGSPTTRAIEHKH